MARSRFGFQHVSMDYHNLSFPLIEEALNLKTKIISYEQYDKIAMHQDSLGEEWILATIIMVVTFLLCMAYNIIRHPVIKGYPWKEFPLFVMNKGISKSFS